MKLFERYMLKNLGISMVFITLTVSLAVWLTQSIRFLQLVVGGGATIGSFIMMVLLSLPNFISVVLPIALLSIILFIYNRMTLESELVVLRAAGLRPWSLARPAIVLSLIVAVVIFAMNAYISPVANRTMKTMRADARNDLSNILLREGVFNTLGSLTIYVRERDTNGDMLGLVIEDDKDPASPTTIVAKRGVLVDTATGPKLIIYDGERQEFDREKHLSRLTFEDYSLDLKFLDTPEADRWLEPSDRTLPELLRETNDPRDKDSKKYFFAEANSRITSPLFAIDFALIGLASLLLGEFDRRGQSRRIIQAVILAIGIQIVSVGLSNLARKYTGVIPLMYVAGTCPIIFCSWLILGKPRNLLARTFRAKP
jgi:lipopolysaccharide export system permease protein